MRIVQTFWTGNHDPLEYGFGWPHAEYNLMSWALSCLSLREHYDEVVLYTDSAGKRILIDELHLPYTDVQVVFDDFPCLPQHWALAKIKTYSLQTKPFLHVDGDIYVPHPLPEDVLAAPLIAQNREIGTVYYRRMMDRILSHPDIKLPDYIEQGLREESIASYNMGFFGGRDLDFIHRYCDEVFRFMEKNRMNDSECLHSRVDCNVFFEQVIFASMVDKECREVFGVLGHDMCDNGYKRIEFCDLPHYNNHLFHHLLGGHKRNTEVQSSLAQAILWQCPDYYIHILSLFPERHVRFGKSREKHSSKYISVERSIAQYEDFVIEMKQKWRKLTLEDLLRIDRQTIPNIYFNFEDEAMYDNMNICGLPEIVVYHIPKNWNPIAIRMIGVRIGCKEYFPLRNIALLPTLIFNGIKEIPIGYTDVQILSLLHTKKMTYREVVDNLYPQIGFCGALQIKGAFRHVMHQINYLSQNKLIETRLTN